jgi:hypothetical protein
MSEKFPDQPVQRSCPRHWERCVVLSIVAVADLVAAPLGCASHGDCAEAEFACSINAGPDHHEAPAQACIFCCCTSYPPDRSRLHLFRRSRTGSGFEQHCACAAQHAHAPRMSAGPSVFVRVCCTCRHPFFSALLYVGREHWESLRNTLLTC